MKVYPTCCSLGRLICLLAVAVFGSDAQAQLPVTQLRAIFPPGAQAGQTVQVSIVEGSDVDEISHVIFNHPGIQLQGKLDPLTNPKAFTIQIAADVPPGFYSFRVQGRYGVSNPRMFRVDALASKVVQEADLQKESPLVCDINSAIYSRCEARNDIDEYAFQLQANKKYELRLDSISLDSLLIPVLEVYQPNNRRLMYRRQIERNDPCVTFTTGDAGIYRVKVYDFLFRGAASYNYRLSVCESIAPESLDPPVLQQVAQSGIKGLHQQAVSAGSASSDLIVADYQLQVQSPVSSSAISGFISPRQALNPLLYARLPTVNRGDSLRCVSVSKYPLVADKEPNDTPEQAQKVSVPSEIYGRFLKPGDRDVYQFHAKKGENFWLQIFSERDGQSLDPYVKLEKITTDAKGKQAIATIAIPDDVATNLYSNVFDTMTDDIDYLLKVPADADYRVTVSHRYHFNTANRLDHYRLRISAPSPSFHAVAMVLPNISGALTADTPSGCVVRKGGTATFKVLLNRIQGFAESVRIEAASVPPGVTIAPVVIPATASSCEVILRATDQAPIGFAEIVLTARAVDSKNSDKILEQYPAVRVTPATISWKAQPTSPAVSRLGHTLVVSVVREVLPAQVQSDKHPAVIHVSQAEQLWHSLEVKRSNGFADKVIIKASGIDKKTKIDVVAGEIPKDKQSLKTRFSFKADAKTGWHVCLLKSEAQFNYVRNPELLARTEQQYKKIEADQTAKAAALANAKKQQAEKTKLQADANKSLAEQIKKQQALQKQIDAQNKTLVKLKDDLQKSEEEQQKAARQKLVDAKVLELTNLTKELTAAQAKVKESMQSVSKVTAELKTAADSVTKLNTEAESVKKSLAAYKKTLDQVKKAQAAKKTKYEAIEDRLVFYVHPSAMTLTLKSPAEITLKKGETAEATIEIARKDAVKGAVVVSMTLPPGVTGLETGSQTLNPDQNKATVKITAAADATSGKHQFCTIRGTIIHDGQSLNVDVPLTITIP